MDAFKTDIAHRGDYLRSPSGDLDRISGLANLKQALFHRLMTVPGTLVHRPTYGVGLPLYQNNLSSFVAQQKLASLIEEQFLRDPRVSKLSSVGFIADDLNPQLTVVRISIKPVGYSDGVEMVFTPFGAT